MESSRTNAVHLLAGGVGGTFGAILTCPLEVVKTRLQSSVSFFTPVYIHAVRVVPNGVTPQVASYGTWTSANTSSITTDIVHHQGGRSSIGIFVCLRHIVETEGLRGLFKGLGPNLVGVAPSRAIYFCTYAKVKQILNRNFPAETPLVHMCSAFSAGFAASTATNPIWFIKTRLQLDQKREGSLTCQQCIRRIYNEKGLRGFYKGITASYFGITETVIHFVIYEAIKAHLLQYSNHDRLPQDQSSFNFLRFMVAGAVSKTCATCIAYPHEVARTRLRQEGNKYTSFMQTLLLVFKEEGTAGLYRGLATQLVRQIPNTAVMMATYEAVVYLLS